MPLVQRVEYIHEPTDLQCGQAVLAMLSSKSVDEMVKLTGTDRETNLKQMFFALEGLTQLMNTIRLIKYPGSFQMI